MGPEIPEKPSLTKYPKKTVDYPLYAVIYIANTRYMEPHISL
jgi:hypothetical protein